ncbi:MAG: DMT family transporter [Clostridia bacterium]|nr:DMT family transporter [Clostridia bacterium]
MTQKKYAGVIGRILLVITTVIWGSSFVILKDTLTTFGGGHFTFFVLAARFAVGAFSLAVFALIRRKKFDKKILVKGCIVGVILFAAYGFQTVGLLYTTPSKNAFLTPAYCMIVPILGWVFFKNRPKLNNYVAAGLMLIGIAFVSLIGRNERGENELLGDMLTICSSLFYALQILFNEHFVKEDDDPINILVVALAVVSVLCVAVSGAVEFPFYFADLSISFDVIWKILYLGIFATAFAQFSQIYAQGSVSGTTTSLILSLEGVFGVFFEVVLGETHITPLIVVGFVIIFIAEIISELGLPPWKKNIAE